MAPIELRDIAAVVTAVASLISIYFVVRMGARNLEISRQQALVSERQAETAQIKLRLDLFDRRVKVYDELWRLAVDVYAKAPWNEDRVRAFEVAKKDIRWLFSEDLAGFVNGEMYTTMHSMDTAYQVSKAAPSRENNRDVDVWEARLSELMRALPERFGPFLRLDRDAKPK